VPDLSLAKLAEITGATLHGEADCCVSSVAALDQATAGQLSFLTSARFRQHLPETLASVVILQTGDLDHCPCSALVTDNPYLAYAKAATALYAEARRDGSIHPSAVVDKTAEIAASVCIDANCTIGARVKIAEGAIIGANCVIAEDVVIGAGTRLVASVTLGKNIQLGARCLIYPSAVIGSDGFGMANDAGRWVKVPQLGRVIVGDDVEIGACTAVDRGAIQDTIIANGVKLDNQIHISHNVELGEHTAIAAGTGIAGSTKVGAYCTMAGAVGVAGHIELADHVHISGLTAVTRSIKEPGIYTSTVPAMPHAKWRKNFARLKQLDEMARRLKVLEKELAATKKEET